MKQFKLVNLQLKDDERWVVINNARTNYVVKKDGTVISYQKNPNKPKVLKPIIFWIYNQYGNRVILDSDRLYRGANIILPNGKEKLIQIHRLVATAFIPNPCKYPEVNHKDGNKSNNDVSNLEWCSGLYNIHEAYRLGLKRGKKGSKHPMSTISENQAFEIAVLLLYTDLNRRQVSELTNVNLSIVRKINEGVRWKSVTSSFNSEYPLARHKRHNLEGSTTREKQILSKYKILN